MGVGGLDDAFARTRLRQGETIVGFERPTPMGPFYSADGLWWRGVRIDHQERDACFLAKDVQGKYLYENDIAMRTTDDGEEHVTIVRVKGHWFLGDVGGTPVHKIEDIEALKLRFVSHLWLNQ